MTFGGLRFEKEISMKKLLTVCVAAVLLLSLAACGKTVKESPAPATTAQQGRQACG